MYKVLIKVCLFSALGLFVAGCQSAEETKAPEPMANATEAPMDSPASNSTEPVAE